MNSNQLELLKKISGVIRVLENLGYRQDDPVTVTKAISIWVNELNKYSIQLKNTVTETKH